MDFEAIVHMVLPPITGTGARGEWTKQEVVFELAQDQYGRKICVGFWNDKAPGAAALRVGERVMVSANVESREHNGRWFTEVRAWRFTVINANAPAQGGGYGAQQQGGYQQPQAGGYGAAAPAPAPAATPAATEVPLASPSAADDLPF